MELRNNHLIERTQVVLLNQLKQSEAVVTKTLSLRREILKSKYHEHETICLRILQLRQEIIRIQNSSNGSLRISENFNRQLNSLDDDILLLKKSKLQRDKCFNESNSILTSIVNLESYLNGTKEDINFVATSSNRVDQSIITSAASKEQQDEIIQSLAQQLELILQSSTQASVETRAKESEISEFVTILEELDVYQVKVLSEKTELHRNWNLTLKSIGQRDELIKSVRSKMKYSQNENQSVCAAMNRRKQEVVLMRENNQNKRLLMQNTEKGVSSYDERICYLKVSINQARADFSESNESLVKMDVGWKLLEAISRDLNSNATAFASTIPILMAKSHAASTELLAIYSLNRRTCDTIKLLNTQKSRVLIQSHKLDIDNFALEHEIDMCASSNVMMVSMLESMNEQNASDEAEFQDKESHIEYYQSNLKQRADLVSKKLSRSEKLLQMLAVEKNESRGQSYLSSFDDRLQRQANIVDQVIDECDFLEKSWLLTQSELTYSINEVTDIVSQKRQLKARVCVLSQQKVRLLNDLENCSVDIKSAKQNNEKLQQEITKLNFSLGSHEEKLLEMQSKCFSSKKSHDEKIAEFERLSSEVSDRIRHLRTMTRELLLEIADTSEKTCRCEISIQSVAPISEREFCKADGTDQLIELDLRNTSQRLQSVMRIQNTLRSAIEDAVRQRGEIAQSLLLSSSTEGNCDTQKQVSSLVSDISDLTSKFVAMNQGVESKLSTVDKIENHTMASKVLILASSSRCNVLISAINCKQSKVRTMRLADFSKRKYLSLQSKHEHGRKKLGSRHGLSDRVKDAVMKIRDSGVFESNVLETMLNIFTL